MTQIDANQINPGAATVGQVLKYNGSEYAPADDSSGGGSSSGNVITNKDYPAGESIVEGDSLFVEEFIQYVQVDSSDPIGRNMAETRYSFNVISSGNAATTLKLALKKVGSPSQALGIRIETDNAGVPSGTLIHPNATATVLAASLTTNLQDITITLAGISDIAIGTKCHIVLYMGAYGSETISSTNYYEIGFYDVGGISTSRYYNGTVWTTTLPSTYTNVVHSGYSSLLYNQTTDIGISITATSDFYIKEILMGGYEEMADVIIMINGVAIPSSINGYVVTLNVPYLCTSGNSYNIGRGSVNQRDRARASVTYPINCAEFTVTGSYGGNPAEIYSIGSITTYVYGYANQKNYVLSDLFTEALYKTDANYTYMLPKTPMISANNYSAGEMVEYDVDGLSVHNTTIEGNLYYVSNTPGQISTSPGANTYVLGMGESNNRLKLTSGIWTPYGLSFSGIGPAYSPSVYFKKGGMGYFTLAGASGAKPVIQLSKDNVNRITILQASTSNAGSAPDAVSAYIPDNYWVRGGNTDTVNGQPAFVSLNLFVPINIPHGFNY